MADSTTSTTGVLGCLGQGVDRLLRSRWGQDRASCSRPCTLVELGTSLNAAYSAVAFLAAWSVRRTCEPLLDVSLLTLARWHRAY